MDPRTNLHSAWQRTEYSSIVGAPVTVFVGIDDQGARLLARMGIRSVFDLANAPAFLAAEELVLAAEDATHLFRRLGRVSDALVDGHAATLSVEQWPTQPATSLSAIGAALGPLLAQRFDLHTVGEVARFAPYQCAKEIVRLAAGIAGELPSADDSTPVDLLPINGQYPTDRVYYRSILLRRLLDLTRDESHDASAGVDLNLASSAIASGPGYGAFVTWEQLWTGQGVALGNLLHSLALAPGEATMLAIVDWTRTVSAATVESIDQAESLSASTEQNRALSEVTQGVAAEVQSGFSNTLAAGSTQSTGASAGTAASASGTIPIPAFPLNVAGGAGLGVSAGNSNSVATSTTVAYTAGTRETFAAYAQNVSESTQQHASSARSRRASVVQEIRESTTEKLQTRVVANYNHMHAMSVHYYETVQIFRVVLQAVRAEKCAFVPIAPLDFSDDAVIERFAPILRQVARDPYLIKMLATSIRVSLVAPVHGAAYVRLPSGPQVESSTVPVESRRSARSRRTSTTGPLGTGGVELQVPVDIPGPIQVAPTARFTVASASAGGEPIPVTVTFVNGESFSYEDPTVDWPVLDVQSLLLTVAESASEAQLTLGLTTAGVTQKYRITVPTSEGESEDGVARIPALVVVGGEVSATDLALARAHLIAERVWYTARIWERIDITTISALLAQYRFQGKALLSSVDPRLIGVTGTHAIFRMLLDDAGQLAWLKELEEWGITGPGSRREDLVPLPTGGVFAEAVLGRSNAAEKLDLTRFWNWQDSPTPLTPPALAPLQAGLQTPSTAPLPGQLDASIINMVQPNPLPTPTGLAATLGLLGAAGIFRDMSFGAQNIDAATAAGAASVIAQTAALNAAQQAFATAAALATSASLTGALMNAAEAGLPGAKERLMLPTPPQPPAAQPPVPVPPVPVPPVPVPPVPVPVPPVPVPPVPVPVPPVPVPPDPVPPVTPPHESVATIQLLMSVPTSSVRLDFARAAIGAVPPQLATLIDRPVRYMAHWIAAVGFDADTTTDTVFQAIELLVAAPFGAPALAALVEGLKGIVDFLGGEVLLSQETIDAVTGQLNDFVQLLQSIMFPCLSGGEWMDAQLIVDVQEGQPVARVEVAQGVIQYGFQSYNPPVEGGAWWAGEGSTFSDALSTFITDEQLKTTSVFDSNGALSVTVTAAVPLAFDWLTATGLCAQRLKELLQNMLAVGGVVEHLASLGVTASLAEMNASIDGWCSWWQENFFVYLTRYSPGIDFNFTITIEPTSEWNIVTDPKHQPFPYYAVILQPRSSEASTIPLYEHLISSPTGPLSFLLAASTYPTKSKSVPGDAIGDWR